MLDLGAFETTLQADDINVCLALSIKVGSVYYRLTNYPVDVTLSGNTYAPDTFVISTISYNSGDSVTNCNIMQLTDTDLRSLAIARRLPGAEVVLYYLNPEDADNENYILISGVIRDIQLGSHMFTASIATQDFKSYQNTPTIFSNECTLTFGDSNCGIDTSDHDESGTVTTEGNRMTFRDSSMTAFADNYFQFASLTFSSGNNDGIARDIKDFTSSTGEFVFFTPFPYLPESGDAYDTYRSCDYTRGDCKDTFDNVINFRGYSLDAPNSQDLVEETDD